MSVDRVALSFETNFTRIPNAWVRDKRLSRRARGFLAELMSHDIGWTVTFDSLIRNGPEGRDAVKAAMRELETCGYLSRIQNKDADGKFGNLKYVISDPEVRKTADWKTVDGEAASGEPATKKNLSSSEDQVEEVPPPAAKRASQLRPEFTPTSQMLAWASKEAPLVDTVFETRQFIDHHIAKGSLMKDWNRAWQTWIRNAQKWTTQKNPQLAGGFDPNAWMNG